MPAHDHAPLTSPCHACGEPTFGRDLHSADDLRDEVIALLQIHRAHGRACRTCVDRAEREIDGAAEALALDSDPAFATVCDARRDAWIACLDAETAPQWAAVVRAGGDVLDRAVTA
jgi:hypothetical protein